MKTKRLLLLIPLVSFLFSCTNNRPVDNKTWSEEDASIMRENLFGEVLPFLDKENLTVTYNTEYKELTITGGVINDGDLAKYAKKYTEKDGWVGGDISSTNKLSEGVVFEFDKTIAFPEGKRFLNVRFSALNGNLYSKTGEFFLSAISPYTYEFPTEDVKELVATYFGSEVSLPVIEGDYYEFSFSKAYLSVYFESTLTDGGYSSILKENDWIVKDELVDDYYLATSPDKKYIIHYLYLPNYGALDIYFDTAKEFPTELINQFFKKYEVTGISIPVYEGALGGFVFAENPNNETYIEMGYPENISATVICYTASEQSYLNYLTKLEGLNWEINKSISSADATYNLSDAIYSMSIKYSSNENAAVITVSGYLEKIGDNGWPSTSIKALLPSGITDVVPAFEGDALGYKILNDAWGTAVYVQVTKGTELDCVESYKATLLKNGYTFSHKDALGDSYYLSPNKQLVVGVYYATPGSITIPFEAAESN